MPGVMSVQSPSASVSASPQAFAECTEAEHRRRKLRKGTHSCWECKRRKIRCIYAPSDGVTCINCRRRGTACAGQELPETLPPARQNPQSLCEGITKVQVLLNDLVGKLNTDAHKSDPEASVFNDKPSTADLPIPHSNATVTTTTTAIASADASSLDLPSSEQAISAALLAAFPCQADTEILLYHSRKVSYISQLINSDWQIMLSRADFDDPPLRAPVMPTVKTHPVVLARLMLGWAVFMQIPKKFCLYRLSEPPNTIKERLATAAIKLVTSNSELHGSLDALECILMEGMFHTHAGNLRRAWTAYRTAVAVAQLMGIHRFPHRPLVTIDRGATFHPPSMWHRIVYMERYLSLLLGLPQSTSASSSIYGAVWTASLPEHEPPIRKFQRSLTGIAGRILERNELGLASYSQDQLLDAELLKLSQSMPIEFWRPPNFDGIESESFDEVQEASRIMAQVFYFYLLNQLHLPYMLSFIHDEGFHNVGRHQDYSSITCANACREILVRFTACRTFNHKTICFRPVDVTTLSAGWTLLLAHLDSHLSQSQGPSVITSKSFLAHQRLSDRALLEEVVQKLDVVSQYHHDAWNLKCAELNRALLKIEDAAARRGHPQWTPTETVAPLNSSAKENDCVLRISIPCLGDIRISRGGCISKVFLDGAALPESSRLDSSGHLPGQSDGQQQQQQLSDEASLREPVESQSFEQPRSNSIEDWPLQGADLAFFDSLMLDGTELGECLEGSQ